MSSGLRTVRSCELLSAKVLSQFLQDVEPGTLSLANLKRTSSKHSKHADKTGVHEIWEFVFMLSVQNEVLWGRDTACENQI